MPEEEYLQQVRLTPREHAVLLELAARQELSPERVFIQGLRLYQLHCAGLVEVKHVFGSDMGGCMGDDWDETEHRNLREPGYPTE